MKIKPPEIYYEFDEGPPPKIFKPKCGDDATVEERLGNIMGGDVATWSSVAAHVSIIIPWSFTRDPRKLEVRIIHLLDELATKLNEEDN